MTDIMTVKGFFKGAWEFFRYLFTPNWGSKRRLAQQAYEERLEKAVKEVQRNT